MKRQQNFKQLERIARASLDRDLAELKAAVEARDALTARLAGLEPAAAPDLDPLTAARIGTMHQIWADARRAEINIALARSTAEWLEKQEEARKSFGRWQILDGMAGALRRPDARYRRSAR
jgi:hypothetical protein